MSDKIKLTILGISTSQIQSGAYALILAQVDGPNQIPIVIGAAEAQSIAIKLEEIHPPRPLTHDLFVSFAHGFGIKMQEVFIYKFDDGVFYSEITFSDGDRTIKIDSRTSDAIALAIRTKAPIYTTAEIISKTGFKMESADGKELTATDLSEEQPDPRIENYTIEELKKTLARLIDEEKYEEASEVNKILQQKIKNAQ